jgi:hypothetical protein
MVKFYLLFYAVLGCFVRRLLEDALGGMADDVLIHLPSIIPPLQLFNQESGMP